MKNNKNILNVSIAIPAFNEEINIGNFLESVVKQKVNLVKLKDITVYSDGSTDKTNSIVKLSQKKHKLIKLVADNSRKGKIYRLNQIFKTSSSDILIVLDADIALVENDFIDRLSRSLIEDNKAQMICADQIPICPHGFIARSIYASYLMWDYIRFSIPKFDHVQNFYGAATAYKKYFYKKLHIPDGFSEERLYIYTYAKKLNGFRYTKNASIKYWTVSTIEDYLKLSNRAFGKKIPELDEQLELDSQKSIIVPLKYKIIGIIKSFIHQPLYSIPALFLNFFLSKLTTKKKLNKSGLWEITGSSKKTFNQDQSKKPIIIISSFDSISNSWYGGGGALSVHQVFKRLTHDYIVTVISGKYPDSKNETIDGIIYKRIGISMFGPLAAQFIFALILPFYTLTREFDIWIENFTPPFSTSFLQLFTRKPVIGLVHMLSAEDMERKYKLPFHFIENIGLKTYRQFIVMSEETQIKIRMINTNALIWIIPNGVDIPKIVKNNGAGEEYLMFIGRIEVNQKGLDLLLQALEKARRQLNVKVKIAGNGNLSETTKLNKLISNLKLQDNVQLLGKVKGKQKDSLFRNALAIIGPSRYETFMMTALEAFSYGLPLISYDIPGLKWIPNNCAIKVKPFSVNELSNSLIKVLTNKDLRKQLSSNCSEFVKLFSWDIAGNNYKKTIDWVLINNKYVK